MLIVAVLCSSSTVKAMLPCMIILRDYKRQDSVVSTTVQYCIVRGVDDLHKNAPAGTGHVPCARGRCPRALTMDMLWTGTFIITPGPLFC